MKKTLQILSALLIVLFIQALVLIPDKLSQNNSCENEEQFWVFNDKG
ncbi:MAG: hypothetical protein POELPBGB_00869 [Bacteroidia bacterium]|nr:hypothetical protein [Bacteroidia bacterium]